MTALGLPAIRALLEGATPGPWRWRNTNGEAMLLGDRSSLVMGFSRMGMNGAQPEFRDADGLMVKAGKENINAYPDAAFIAAAPSIVAQLVAVVEAGLAACEAVIDNTDGHKPPGPPHPSREQATAMRIRAALTGEGQ